ncbi:MAG TPA: amino acid ABC transporter substrate-binding protein [Xanthobacteraceae bacterium]|jgi:glutamate/aspartate transport system substrate-binding protein|nr:amino acid ABC transporter substrate-binding protein [Xanthobacteraceae bacterium]
MLKFCTVLLTVPAMMVFVAGAFAQVSPTLKKIQDRGAIVIGHRDSSVPFSHIDQNQKPVGFTVDLCLKIADAVKDELKKPDIKINYVPVTPQTRFALLANGTIDLECGSTTNTFSRQSQAAFTFTTFITGTKIMVRKDSRIASVDDLRGKTLVVLPGTTNEQALKATIEQKRMNTRVLNVRDHAEALLTMETDRSDAYGSDDVLLYGARSRAKNPDQYVVVGEFLTYDPYAIMLPRNDSAFATLADKSIAKSFRDGSFMQTYKKWFDPIGMPLNPLLEAAIKLQALPD